jgi:hypothetical protein
MELSVAADDAFEPDAANGEGRDYRNSDRSSAASLRHLLSRPLTQSNWNQLDLAGSNDSDLENLTDPCDGK